ncbi:LPS export ABC transporter periplasmic protein LptC [Shewanella marina]|uniref:LPS export ABC transporter periplasmic protein LptC n=1 Tax=Shewanella marina TaxID=487319 RepID=UPI00046ED5E7|nr:LPS export ABC transporter periplasmic protein LptC [Shewanella marina]
MNRTTIAIIALFALAVGLYWQVQVKRDNQVSHAQSVLAPDFVADNLRSVEYNEQGNINSRVTAEHMEHYNSTNKTFFTKPVYLVYPSNGQAQWQLVADKGILDKNSGHVVLENHVIIKAINADEPIQSLTTDYLELDLNTMIMSSDSVIHVLGNHFTIEGKGLYADLNAQTVKLTSQVKGQYEPQ